MIQSRNVGEVHTSLVPATTKLTPFHVAIPSSFTFNNGANFSNAFCFSHCFWLNGGACKPWPTMRSPGLALAGGSINSTFSLLSVSMTLAAHST